MFLDSFVVFVVGYEVESYHITIYPFILIVKLGLLSACKTVLLDSE